jgi:hypothetical protein
MNEAVVRPVAGSSAQDDKTIKGTAYDFDCGGREEGREGGEEEGFGAGLGIVVAGAAGGYGY